MAIADGLRATSSSNRILTKRGSTVNKSLYIHHSKELSEFLNCTVNYMCFLSLPHYIHHIKILLPRQTMLTFLFKIMLTLVLRFVIKFFSKGGEGCLSSPETYHIECWLSDQCMVIFIQSCILTKVLQR